MVRAIIILLLACGHEPHMAGVSHPVEAMSPTISSQNVRDQDHDGVMDVNDRCVDEPEDLDGYEDQDGCVDRDNDSDGVVDAHEWQGSRWTNCDYADVEGQFWDCRNFPEDQDGYLDSDGCPDVSCIDECVIKIGKIIYDPRGRLSQDAAGVFDEIAKVMSNLPDVKIFIDAHIDKQRNANSAKFLTKKLAMRAVEELVRRGIARGRLMPREHGDGVPIASNDRPLGRASNRRLEFVVQGGSHTCGCRLPSAVPFVQAPRVCI